MTDLVEFLRARLDEDAAVAQATLKNEQRVDGTDRWFSSHNNAITSMAPHRAVAEVEAKRSIVNAWKDPDTIPPEDRDEYFGALAIDRAVRALAAVYADHSDYRQEWKP